MFSYPNPFVMISGVLMSMLFIIGIVHYTNRLFVNASQDILVRFILIIFSALVGVFIVDKVIAFKISLLSDEQNNQLFDLIKTLILMIFSYYFGTQNKKNQQP